MDNDIPKQGSEMYNYLGGPVGVWAEGSHVMIKSMTKDGQAVSLTPAEAVHLGEMLKAFAEQIRSNKGKN